MSQPATAWIHVTYAPLGAAHVDHCGIFSVTDASSTKGLHIANVCGATCKAAKGQQKASQEIPLVRNDDLAAANTLGALAGVAPAARAAREILSSSGVGAGCGAAAAELLGAAVCGEEGFGVSQGGSL